MQWMILPFKRYFDFHGRSRRLEFWMFFLLNIIVALVLATPFYVKMIGAAIAADPNVPGSDTAAIEAAVADGGGVSLIMLGLYGIYALAALIPSIAVTVRRLHDRNMTGWWYLGFIVLGLIPFVGLLVSLAFLVILALPGTPGPNKYGQSPKGELTAEAFE